TLPDVARTNKAALHHRDHRGLMPRPARRSQRKRRLRTAACAGHHRPEPMAIIQFPDPRTASPEGIVAIGGDLHPESVIAAYRQGRLSLPAEKVPLLLCFSR